MDEKFARGGGVYALTTAALQIDLTALIGYEVVIYCASQDVYFSGATSTDAVALVTSATAASATALIADRLAAGYKAKRLVRSDQPFLVAATVASTGNLFVKVVSDRVPGA